MRFKTLSILYKWNLRKVASLLSVSGGDNFCIDSTMKTVVAFDLYGTLLSTSSISKELAEHFPDKADAIAGTWRTYQLEYTWRLNSMGVFL
jgi:hypothetical protein